MSQVDFWLGLTLAALAITFAIRAFQAQEELFKIGKTLERIEKLLKDRKP